jgi:hypothetical protein
MVNVTQMVVNMQLPDVINIIFTQSVLNVESLRCKNCLKNTSTILEKNLHQKVIESFLARCKRWINPFLKNNFRRKQLKNRQIFSSYKQISLNELSSLNILSKSSQELIYNILMQYYQIMTQLFSSTILRFFGISVRVLSRK